MVGINVTRRIDPESLIPAAQFDAATTEAKRLGGAGCDERADPAALVEALRVISASRAFYSQVDGYGCATRA